MSADYRDTLERLYRLGQGKMLPGRDRLRQLLREFGDPHLQIPSVLVGGTNGKGSVVAALSAALSLRYRTGAFLKPHLKTIRERWRIDDQPIGETQFIEAAGEALDGIERFGLPISFFEANVLIGALAFRNSGCELAIWEVGLGGREDACNLVDPILSILTSVGLDHTAVLGDTVEEIAQDKADIARAGRPLLLGPPRPGQEQAYAAYEPVIRHSAEITGAFYRPLILDFDADWTKADIHGLWPDTLLTVKNSLEILAANGFPLEDAGELVPWSGLHYRARMEHCLLNDRPVLVDAAHNADSMRWLARWLGGRFDCRLPFAFGCQISRDPGNLLLEVAEHVEVLVPVEVPVLNPCPAGVICESAKRLGIPVIDALDESDSIVQPYPLGNNLETDPPDNSTGWINRMNAGLALALEHKPLIVCGSIYMIGEILRAYEDGWISAIPAEAN